MKSSQNVLWTIVIFISFHQSVAVPLDELIINLNIEDKGNEAMGLKDRAKLHGSGIHHQGHWTLQSMHKPTDFLTVYTAKSSKTGLTVVLANAESPIVNGFFCLATEAKNNWGLPHTLEHLNFMGSYHYPYKNVLDLLGNRCLAARTNAWTATDHTCYTVSTAGSSGFIRILPIYLDHIFHPTLKDGDFLTEVYRVNPEGQDVGVVYSEMQARDEDPGDILSRKLLDLVFPGLSGYNKETGGNLKDLREFTNNAEVKKYHKKFYRPENLVLIITGEIDLGKIQVALSIVEDQWLQENGGNQGEFTRPWLAKLDDFSSTEVEVEFPADDESTGSIYIGWRSEDYITENTKELSAQAILLSYLTESHQGPLDSAIVNIKEPLAEHIYIGREYFKKPMTSITMDSVPIKKLKQTVQVMDEVLNNILIDGKTSFEKNHMETLHTLIDQEHLIITNDNDNSPSTLIKHASVLNHLYGKKPADFMNFYEMETDYLRFKNEKASFWLDILNRTLVLAPRAVVLGKPSINLQTRLEENKHHRIQERNKTLDREKLRKRENDAISSQNPPGKELLNKFPISSVDDITFKKIETFKLSKSFPFKSHIDNVNSEFVQFIIVLNSENLTEREKLLLPTLTNLWKTSPQNKNGIVITKEQVMQKHNKFLLDLGVNYGIRGEFSEAVVFSARAYHTSIEDAIEDIKSTLLFADINLKDIESRVLQKISGIPDSYMDAEIVQNTVINYLTYKDSTNIYLQTLMQQEPFLKKLLYHGINGMQIEFKNIMEKLTGENNCFVYLALDKQNLNSDILIKLSNLLNRKKPGMIIETAKKKNLPEIVGNSNNNEDRFQIVKEYNLKKFENFHIAVGISGTLSCYLSQTIVYNNTDFNSPEVVPLEVLFEYISTRMHDRIRGKGLAYGVSMFFSLTEGSIVLKLVKSSRLVKAIKEVKKILKDFISKNTTIWEQTFLDSAKGSVIFKRTQTEETLQDLEFQSALSYMRNIDATWNRNFIKHVAKVELSDVINAAMKFLPMFFDENHSNTVMVCNKEALDQIVKKIKTIGLNLKKFKTVEEFIKYHNIKFA